MSLSLSIFYPIFRFFVRQYLLLSSSSVKSGLSHSLSGDGCRRNRRAGRLPSGAKRRPIILTLNGVAQRLQRFLDIPAGDDIRVIRHLYLLGAQIDIHPGHAAQMGKSMLDTVATMVALKAADPVNGCFLACCGCQYTYPLA